MRVTRLITAVIIGLGFIGQAEAIPDADELTPNLVKIAVYDGGRLRREGNGFVVSADGYVLTAAHLLAGGDRIRLQVLGSDQRIDAEVVAVHEELDLALLRAFGLSSSGLEIASKRAGSGLEVFSVGNWNLVSGAGAPQIEMTRGTVAMLSVIEVDEGVSAQFLVHNALINQQGYGSPLVNNCGQVLGINRPDPALRPARVRRGINPGTTVYAISADAIRVFLQANGIPALVASEECLTETEVAQDEAKTAQERADEAEAAKEAAEADAATKKTEAEEAIKKAEELEAKAQAEAERADASEEEKAVALEAAETARVEAEEAEKEATALARIADDMEALAEKADAERLKAEAETATARQAEQEAAERLRLGLGIGGLVLLIAIVTAIVIVRKRRQETESAQQMTKLAQAQTADVRAQQARAPKPWRDCLLEGMAGTIKIPATSVMINSPGAVFGRHAENAAIVFEAPEISRAHARLFVKGDALHIEDLGSTNGTSVNGQPLTPQQPMELRSGDQISFGPHVFSLRIL